MPAQLAKAFLNGVFTATVTHLNDEKQRDAQAPPLKTLVDDKNTPHYFKNDSYLGKGNGLQSRLASIEKLKSKAKSSLNETGKAFETYAPRILESAAKCILKSTAESQKSRAN